MNKLAHFGAKFAGVASTVAAVALPSIAFAQHESAGPATFANSYTLWIAIIIGFAVSFATLIFSSQMKGSTVGGVLRLFGAGTFFVVLGFLAVVVKDWAPENAQKLVHDLMFIVGYLFCLAGVLKLRKLSA